MLQTWSDEYNTRYVFTVEELLNDGFSKHQHNEDRVCMNSHLRKASCATQSLLFFQSYGRRRSHEAHSTRDCYLPPHLYGQLAGNAEAFPLLLQEVGLKKMFELLKRLRPADELSESEIIAVKAAIWAVCHVASASIDAAQLAIKENGVKTVIELAEVSPHFGLRGTAFYALDLVAMNPQGAEYLESFNWCAVKSGKDELWPVLEVDVVQQQFLRQSWQMTL
jgi:hypothetical protein